MTKNNTNKPSVLIVLPTLGRRPEYLKKTLATLAAQSPIQFDLVMVFPLKSKETVALAKQYNATMIDDPGGMSAAVNAGIAAAKPWHKYISWIGDDDYLTKESLATSVQALENDPKAVVAFGYCDYMTSTDKYIFTSKAGRLAPWIMRWGPNLIPMPGLLMRKSALDIAGEFDTNNLWSMDLDMLIRLRKIGHFVNTKKTLATFRWHETSQTVANRPKLIKEVSQVQRRHMHTILQKIAPLWEIPVKIATIFAVKKVNRIALAREAEKR